MLLKGAVCAGLADSLEWGSPGSDRVDLEDIFPIPSIKPVENVSDLGGHARARHRIRKQFVEEANSAIDALNWYSGNRSGRRICEEPTPLQKQVTARVEGLVEAMHDPPPRSPPRRQPFLGCCATEAAMMSSRVLDSMSLAPPRQRTFLFL